MIAELARRGLHVILVLFGVSVIVFGLLHLAPGDAATALLGPQASEAAKAVLRQQLGLDQPIFVQYGRWLGAILQGDFGTSIVSRNPVLTEVVPRFGNSFILGAAALFVAIAFGITVGVASAVLEGTLLDKVSSAVVQVFGAIPPFWLGLVLVYFFALAVPWFPATGMTKAFGGGDAKDIARHLVLPAITASAAFSAVIVRMVRAVFIETMGRDYVTVARARGVGTMRLLFRHVLPNCMPPILNILGLQMGYLIGGVLFTEVVFAWPGIGQLLYQAILGRDVALVQGCVLFIAASFVLINLAVDMINEFSARNIR